MSPSVIRAEAANCTIRPYRDSDEEAVMEICRITAAHPKRQAEPIRTIILYIFALPYIKLHPSYCSVVADKDDTAVGYIVAVPDSTEYLRRIKEQCFPLFEAQYLPELEMSNPGLFKRASANGTASCDVPKSTGMNDEAAIDGTTLKVTALLNRFWNPDSSILQASWPEMLQEYPTHIHIDILPGYQGQNLGRRLMAELIRKLESEKVKGIHLMKSGDTVGTEKLYEKVGFGRWPFKMGGEVRDGEVGVKPGGGVCMVRKVGK